MSNELTYIRYDAALENTYVPAMRSLISQELSEPYSIYVYRYFLYQWGELCYLAMDKSRPENDQMVGVVVSKLEPHRGGPLRGYIAMLAVREEYRGKGIATRLVRMSIDAMIEREADEVFSCSPGCVADWRMGADDGRLRSRRKSQILPLLNCTRDLASCGVSGCIGTT